MTRAGIIITPLKQFIKKIKKETWAFTAFLCVVGFSLILLLEFTDLTPQVGADFFFSSDNPRFQYDKLISKIFPKQSSQVILSAEGDINSQDYLRRVRVLTDTIELVPGVSGVRSLTSGPKNVKDAMKSPLWKRLLVAADEGSSNIWAFLEDAPPEKIIPKFEDAINLFSAPPFRLKIAGVPYVVEMIRRNLVHDITIFSAVAFLIFSGVILIVFRSLKVLGGTLISCIEACVLTLIITSLMGVKIGILTVNISTIVFVLTLSHIVFLTHNWKTLSKHRKIWKKNDLVMQAVRQTFFASFWCMVTTLLGFLSLLFVQAKPLKELGISGSVGTLAGITAAYGIYPFFLRAVGARVKKIKKARQDRTRAFFIRRSGWFITALFILCLVALPGLWKLNTDPSLFSYFDKNTELRDGLEYIDRNGGSSPLDLVVRDDTGARLDSDEAYDKLWRLQEALENDSDVGSVISLPVLMAEGNRYPLAFLISWDMMLKWMEDPQYNEIAKSFVTEDRFSARFMLRMKEYGREGSRLGIVDRIKSIVRENGFLPEMLGGLFLLQGELSGLVAASLIYGLGRLILFFAVIAFIVSRSWRVSLAMVAGLFTVPIVLFGIIGLSRTPVDIISAPAVNVAIGMGIDSMIHLAAFVRRRAGKGADTKSVWLQARCRLWQPVVSSMFIICAGFSIFVLSAFPPTRRFGLSIVFGTVIASAAALFILPFLSTLRREDVIRVLHSKRHRR